MFCYAIYHSCTVVSCIVQDKIHIMYDCIGVVLLLHHFCYNFVMIMKYLITSVQTCNKE